MGRARYSLTLFKEFLRFARSYRVYWIVPLVLVLALLIVLIAAGQVSAPFIYTLF